MLIASHKSYKRIISTAQSGAQYLSCRKPPAFDIFFLYLKLNALQAKSTSLEMKLMLLVSLIAMFSFILINCILTYLHTWRHGGLVVSALASESRGPGSSPGIVTCCVLEQDTSLSQYLSPPRSINGYQKTVKETLGNAGRLPVMD